MVRRLCRRVACATLLGLAVAGSAQADEPVSLTLHHFLPTTSITHADFLVPWAERVAAASDGRLTVEIFPAMQLGGSPPGLYDQAREGVADIVWTLPGYTPGRFPVIEVFELPFVAGTAAATSQAAQAYYEAHADKVFTEVQVLLVHVHAPGTFHIRGRAVESLADLAGLTVRAPSRITNQTLAALGAEPVGMPVPEVPQALSRGVIDAALLPWEVARALRVHELADTHTEVMDSRGLYTAVFLLAMNRDRFDGLPADLQAVLRDESGPSLAATAGQLWDEAEEPGRDAAREAGNTIVRVEGDAVGDWRAAAEVVIVDWITEMSAAGHDGVDLLDQARRLIETYSAP